MILPYFLIFALFFFLLPQWTVGNEEQTERIQIENLSLASPYIDDYLSNRHWDFGGDTVIDLEHHIRLTPSYDSRSGWLWTKTMITSTAWEVSFEFKITTPSVGLSADGMAFWYTTSQYQQGNAMGFKTKWEGVGIVFDTYDNSDYGFIFPRISAFVNDGTKEYNKDSNGKEIETAGCDEDIKDQKHPTVARIRYKKGEFLSLEFSTKEVETWKTCFEIKNVTLPDSGYLGFTALTGGLSENHDVLHVNLRSLDSIPQETNTKVFDEKSLPEVEVRSSFYSSLNLWTWSLVMIVAMVVAFGYKYLPKMVKKDYQRF